MIEVVPSTWDHVHDLKYDLRDGEQKEITAFGVTPEEGLINSYRVSNLRRTALIDGSVAAMWGVQGSLLGQVGHPFLLTGNKALKISQYRFVSIYKTQLKDMKRLYPILENYVDAEYVSPVRLLKITGFSLSPTKINNRDFYRFTMVTE